MVRSVWIFVPFQVYACMMVFFLSNMIENQCMSTGAFEITLNGKLRFGLRGVTYLLELWGGESKGWCQEIYVPNVICGGCHPFGSADIVYHNK